MPELDVPFHDPRISMNYWWPRIEGLDIPTPDTELVPVEYTDEGDTPVVWDTDALMDAMESFETEQAFLRTDVKAANYLDEAGYIFEASPEAIDRTVMCLLLQMSDMDFLTSSLAIRERLDLDVYATCYMRPVTPEVRVFVDEGDVLCHHLRPDISDFDRSVDNPNAMMRDMRAVIDEDWDDIRQYAELVAQEFDDEGWSVDFIRTADGEWVCTDMALYGLYYNDVKDNNHWNSISNHESGCPHNLEEHLPDALPETPVNARTQRLDDDVSYD